MSGFTGWSLVVLVAICPRRSRSWLGWALFLSSGELSPVGSCPKTNYTHCHKWKILLKTFNIVVAWFKNGWTLMSRCCLMMFRWINKQPGIQKFWNSCSRYQNIYWFEYHHLINRQTDGLFIIQQSMGRNEYCKSGHCLFFTSLKHLMMLLKCDFLSM